MTTTTPKKRRVKWHKFSSPAFYAGQKWVSTAGNCVYIVEVRKYLGAKTDHSSDYGVTYEWAEHGKIVRHEKDVWNFQVRYTHISELIMQRGINHAST